MNIFYPFIHKKKETIEPAPLYVELILPIPENKEEYSEEKDEPGVIIIEIF